EQDPKQTIRFLPSVIRLQALDECKRAVGDPIPGGADEDIARNRRLVAGRRDARKWGLGWSLPIGRGKVSGPLIPFDEFEKQVIERGSELVDKLSRDKRDLGRRRSQELYLLSALRLRDDFIRVTTGIVGDAHLDFFRMFKCPDDFPPRGVKGTRH